MLKTNVAKIYIAAKTITIKYFEPGHSFMSADSFHHQVEQAIKHNPKIDDLDDFHNTVQSAWSGKVDVKVMAVGDFYDYEDWSSAHRLKNTPTRIYLREIVEVQVTQVFLNLYIKKLFRENDYIIILNNTFIYFRTSPYAFMWN